MKKICFTLLMALPLFFAGCNEKKNNALTPELLRAYVLVYYQNAQGNAVAAYWNNGRLTDISDGTYNFFPSAIAVLESTIYIAGIESPEGGPRRAVLWVGGQKQLLPSQLPNSDAYDLFVSDQNVYVAGTEFNYIFEPTPVLWVNGQRQALDSKGLYGVPFAVAVDGKDVYVVGSLHDDGFIEQTAAAWKNGKIENMTDNDKNATPTDIIIANGNRYILGSDYNEQTGNHDLTLWTNGAAAVLKHNNRGALPSSVCVEKGSVYVTGEGYNEGIGKAELWKNGVLQPLEGVTPGINSTAAGICIGEEGCYVAGKIADRAVLWIDGKCHYLTDDRHTEAQAVAVCIGR